MSRGDFAPEETDGSSPYALLCSPKFRRAVAVSETNSSSEAEQLLASNLDARRLGGLCPGGLQPSLQRLSSCGSGHLSKAPIPSITD